MYLWAKNMAKNISKNVSTDLSGKYSQKLVDHAKQSTSDALKKTVKTTGDLTVNKIASNIT